MTGIFTLDALVALAMATVIISASIFLFSAPKYPSREYVYQLSTDLLAILDENAGLERLTVGDTTKLYELKATLPQKICLEIKIIDSNDIVIFIEDSGCEEGEYAISRRSFIKDSERYISEARVWLR